MSKRVKLDHLKDVDFRTREVRQQMAIGDFKRWYRQLASMPASDRITGQLTMLSSVLWYLLPKNEYENLVTSGQLTSKPTNSDADYQIELGLKLRDMLY